jgi:Zn finger protein HypA/HybF involved in hydrogenase expression
VHEMSVALEVCRIAEEQVGREALPLVREVGLIVGSDSGVEPDNLEFCLEALLSQSPFTGARVAMDRATGDELRVTYLEVDDGGAPD